MIAILVALNWKMSTNICLYLSHFAANVKVTRDRIPREILKNHQKCLLSGVFSSNLCWSSDNKDTKQYPLVNHRIFDVMSTFTRILMAVNMGGHVGFFRAVFVPPLPVYALWRRFWCFILIIMPLKSVWKKLEVRN